MSPERYRILDHGGDGKIRAFGATLEEAFGNAALAVASLMTDWEKVEDRVERVVDVAGRDLGHLLVRFLSEILYLSDAHGFVLGGVADLAIEAADAGRIGPGEGPVPSPSAGAVRLTGRFRGDDRPGRYVFHGDVKAITFSELKIESCACGPAAWSVQVVVDL
jgi:SHS2 domain-containing protein